MWPTRIAFAELQDAERSTRRTAADKPKRVQIGVFDLEPHPNRLLGKRTVPVRIPGDVLRDLVTLERVAVIRREIGQWPAVGVLDLDPHVAAGTNQAVDLQSSARISQDADKVVLAVQPRVRVPERGVLGYRNRPW